MQQYRDAMSRALFLANRASSAGDVPVGAVVLDPLGNVIGEGWNVREAHHDPTGHAEMMALRQAGERLRRWNLVGCTLVVTLEPCTMCAGAAVAARVDRVVFGAWEPKTGAAGSLRDVLRDSRMGHQIEVVPGVLAQEASAQLTAFFEECRRREALKGRVAQPLSASFADGEVSSRSLSAALRAQAAKEPRSWEGENAGKAQSLVRPEGSLLEVEWDEGARARFGKLPRVPELPKRPRYRSLSNEELRRLDAERKGIAFEPVPDVPAAIEAELAPSAVPPTSGGWDVSQKFAPSVTPPAPEVPVEAAPAVPAPAVPEPVVSAPVVPIEEAPVESPALDALPPELRTVIAGIAQRRRQR